MSTSTSICITGKTIVITGGGAGIGRELVRALHSTNSLYVVDVDAKKLDLLQKECPTITPIAVDLCDWDATRNALENALPKLVHCLVNNAGIGDEAGFFGATSESLDKVIGVNARAIVNVSQVVAKRIMDYNEGKTEASEKVLGSIVNVSSLASKFPTRISTGYNVTKAAVDMLTKGMALELGPHNIRVNSVNPGIVLDTDLAQEWVRAAGNQLTDRLLARTPLRRVVKMKDVANAILFMLSDASPMVHGESLLIDGGYSAA